MALLPLHKSTIVRLQQAGLRVTFGVTERVAPALGGRVAEHLWFATPPMPPERAMPACARPFTVTSQGAHVRGHAWGEGPVVYLLHGWGGRSSQLTPYVDALLRAGLQVVAFDALSHGGSDPGPSGPGRSTAVEFGRALDDVAARFGPAHAVVAHSMGAMATMLAMRHGWLGAQRLALVAPMLSIHSALDVFSDVVGIGPRTRSALGGRIEARVRLALSEFDADVLLTAEIPTLVVHDRNDRQMPYAASASYVARHPRAEMLSTNGLGHQRVLRDTAVVAAVVAHVGDNDRRLTVDLAS